MSMRHSTMRIISWIAVCLLVGGCAVEGAVFGRSGSSGDSDDLWEFNLTTGAPSIIAAIDGRTDGTGHSMVFDYVDGQMYSFNSSAHAGVNTWLMFAHGLSAPLNIVFQNVALEPEDGPAYPTAAVYDAIRDEILLMFSDSEDRRFEVTLNEVRNTGGVNWDLFPIHRANVTGSESIKGMLIDYPNDLMYLCEAGHPGLRVFDRTTLVEGSLTNMTGIVDLGGCVGLTRDYDAGKDYAIVNVRNNHEMRFFGEIDVTTAVFTPLFNLSRADVISSLASNTVPPTDVYLGAVSVHDGAPFVVTIDWVIPKRGFAIDDITVTGGSKSDFAQLTSKSFTLTVTPDSLRDNVVVSIAANLAAPYMHPAKRITVSPPVTDIEIVLEGPCGRTGAHQGFSASRCVRGFIHRNDRRRASTDLFGLLEPSDLSVSNGDVSRLAQLTLDTFALELTAHCDGKLLVAPTSGSGFEGPTASIVIVECLAGVLSGCESLNVR